jgi:NAD(P)-dependent dehydrogenase (short-subunit alcohol dehydrogenase family)
MNMGKLEGRTAIVTGGGRGLGKAIAEAFADEGADVAVLGRGREALDDTVAAIEQRGRRGLAVVADLRDTASIPETFDRVESELGDLDILVNNAGLQGDMPALEVTESVYDDVVDTNLKAVFFSCQAAGRRMVERGSGKIINLGSTFSLVGAPNFAVYCATKGAILQLTKTLAIEWSSLGVNVNAIGPTAVRTDMMRPLLDDPEFAAAFMPKVPAGRLPEPEDIGRSAVFLASDDSDMVHGHLLMVDCGFTVM